MKTIQLNNGVEIPVLGSGPGSAVGWDSVSCWGASRLGRELNRLTERVRNKRRRLRWLASLAHQFSVGYRLIDHSIAYGDDFLITEAIGAAGISRSDVRISSRFSNQNQYQGHLHKAFKQLKLRLGGVGPDLFGFHWPVPERYIATYKFLEELYRDGEIGAIALCNCHEHHLERILQECDIVPAINQVEVHPLFTQKKLISFCKERGIVVQAYTPLARNDERLRKARAIIDAASKYGKTPGQIILRWHIQQGLVPIVRSSNTQRQEENISLFDFELQHDEMQRIDQVNIGARVRYDPDNCDFTQL